MDCCLINRHVTDTNSFQSFQHNILGPWRRVRSRQFDALALAATVQRSRRNAKFGARLLHRCVTATDRFERPFQVFWRPCGRRCIERSGQSDALATSDFVQRRRWDSVGFRCFVGGYLAGSQRVQRVVERILVPRLGRPVLFRCVDAQAMGTLPQCGRRYAKCHGCFR